MTINRREAQQIAAHAARELRQRGRTLEKEIAGLEAMNPHSIEAQRTARRLRESFGRDSPADPRDT